MIDRCRKYDKVGETIEHVTAGRPSLSEYVYLGTHYLFPQNVGSHDHLANNIIRLQIAMTYEYKLLGRNTPPDSRYKPEPVLESANMILHWDRSTITNKTFPTMRLR